MSEWVDRLAVKHEMTTWHKRDWEQFYELARRPWRRHRPPRPVYPTGLNRVLPAQGFSLSELDDAGVDLDLAERLGLPVDAGRIGAYGPNVTVLRDFVRSSRQPLQVSFLSALSLPLLHIRNQPRMPELADPLRRLIPRHDTPLLHTFPTQGHTTTT